MSYYLVVFQGGGALGAAVFGILAQDAGLKDALLIATAGLLLTAVAGLRIPFKSISSSELLPAGDWPAPQLHVATDSRAPVLVTVEYHPRPGSEQQLLEALSAGRKARRRTGAINWRVWRDSADPGRVMEQFIVGSWNEHLRQHERVSRRDQMRLTDIEAMTDPDRPTVVTHWLTAETGEASRSSSVHPSLSDS
jgi:hypothetical protein